MLAFEPAPGASRLILTNEPHAPAAACAHVRHVAARLGFQEDEVAAIELGVEEATANVVRHAFPAGELHSFDVTCVPTALGLEIRIHDKGLPFDPSLLPAFDAQASLAEDGSAGLGTLLMRRVFDEVVFRNLGRDGKQTCLVKHRRHAPIGDYAVPLAAAQPPQAEQNAVSEVRRMLPHEAIEVARCVYESYGYSYPYEHIYYPERVQALNASGEILSVVAVTPDGRIAGHSALVFDGKGAAELAIAVTRPEFRGQGVARRIGDLLLHEARQAGVRCVYTKAVTAHTFTQQFCHALGFRDCALLPGHAPASIQFRNIAEHLQQRESCILALYRAPDVTPSAPALYLPVGHVDMLQALYAHIGMSPQWQPLPAVSDGTRTSHSHLTASVSSGLELAVVEVEDCGSDIGAALQRQLLQLRREHIAVVELLLSLHDAACVAALPEIERQGFFFTGVFPDAQGVHRLVMHYLIDPAIDYARIQAHAAVAQGLLDYVRRRDPGNAMT